jgi:hypothetical protein
MKKVKIALLMLMAVVFILPSCKKGENDPFLSLKSRKGRMVGEWTLKEGSTTETQSGGTTTSTFTATQLTETDASGTTIYPYTEKVTYDKDGTFKIETSQTYTVGSISQIVTDIYEGCWYFAGANKELELKNKEQVIMTVTKETYTSGSTTDIYTWSGASCPIFTMLLDELKSKESVVILDGTYVGSSSSTVTGTKTYEKK